MTTVRLATTALINPPGATPVLTASQAWAGLQRKARRPQDFVPVVDSCKILWETADVIKAVVFFKSNSGVAHSQRISETCTLRDPCRLDYEMEDGSSAVNIISSDSEGELLLTFMFAWVHQELTPGSDEAREVEQKHQATAQVAVKATVATIRKLVDAGEISCT